MEEFYNLSVEKSIEKLNSSKQGLSETEAISRKKYNAQELDSGKKISIIVKFLSQFKDLMILMLLIAAGISIGIGITRHTTSELVDGLIILAIVLMNAIFGVIQENKAEKSLEALKKMTLPEAIVLRNGEPNKVNLKNIVVGDVVQLEAGAIVPADVRIIESTFLVVDESSLTGESVASRKEANCVLKPSTPLADRRNMAYRGCSITSGRGLGLVVATGKNTEIGKIATAIKDTEKDLTPLQKNIKDVGKYLTIIILAMAVLTFILEIVARPGNVLEAFLTAVAISVAAIPESMPAVITIIMSMGVSRLAKQKAVVKHLHSVETLGCCDVICSDKTGTITQNKMTIVSSYCDGHLQTGNIRMSAGYDMLLKTMLLCNDTELVKGRYFGDPTEIALADFGKKLGVDKIQFDKKYLRLNEIPFDSRRKLMTTLNNVDGEIYSFTKGALDSVLPLCNRVLQDGKILDIQNYKNSILHSCKYMTDRSLRVLAFAYKPSTSISENDLIFIGMVGMIDPPRKEVSLAVKKCYDAGMRPIMITGDHKDTAYAIGKEVGIIKNESEILTGLELDKISDDELDKIIDNLRIFARVSPENKVRIVEAFKRRGHVVAMTGDGVNDAPSLKRAIIGIGMGQSGTDVTKEVADLIITDDNFATIVIAVEEGRKIYQNIQKTVKFLFSANLGEMLSLFFATIFFPQYVFLFPVQILFVNLITDSLPAIALGVERPERNLMTLPPRNIKKSLFADGVGWSIIVLGLVQTALVVSAYAFGLKLYNEHVAVTMAFYTLNIIQMFYLASVRTNGSLFKSNPFKNKFILLSFCLCIGVFCLTIFTPFGRLLKLESLNATQWGVILAFSVIMMLSSELFKIIYNNIVKKREKRAV